MHDAHNPLEGLSLVGGRLCLDFANSVGSRGAEVRNDRLQEYGDLLWWGLRAGILIDAEADRLRRTAEARPEEAAAVHRRGIELREAIYRIFSARNAGEEIGEAELEVVNAEVGRAMRWARVVREGQGFAWGWDGAAELDRILWPVARSAAELLTSPERERVGECAADTCGWLYLDTSKNRSRRWCDMKDCGNRAKVRRHYRRHHAE